MKKLNRFRRPIAICFLLIFLSEMIFPTVALALTGGPSQPEVQSFEPGTTTQMVDVPTGDFTYNIPLLDVGGYPVNISYHSGITMDQEASWVGLGWNINPGVINRQKRNLPDDSDGDEVKKEYSIKPNWTAGVDLGLGISFTELPIGLGANTGIYYNNYRGIGFKAGTSFTLSAPMGQKGSNTSDLGINLSLGIQFDTQNGVGVMPNLGLSLKTSDTKDQSTTVGASIGLAYNNRVGISQLTYGISASATNDQDSKKTQDGERSRSISRSSSISFINQPVTTHSDFPMENFGFTAKIQLGGMLPLYGGEMNISGDITGSYSEQDLAFRKDSWESYGYMYMHKSNMNPRAMLDFSRQKDQPFRKPKPNKNDEGTPVMAVPSYDFDLFGVTGQGVSGQHRVMRNDIGSAYNPHVNSWDGSGNFAMDIGIGNYATIGLDVNVNVTENVSGQWNIINNAFNKLKFYGNDNTLYEPAPIINIGEKTINDQSFYDAIGDVDPIRIMIGDFPFARAARDRFVRFQNGLPIQEKSFDKVRNSNRAKRNQVFSFIVAKEASLGKALNPPVTLDADVLDYPVGYFPTNTCGNSPILVNKIDRLAHSGHRSGHMSEITILNDQGQRYVYGIPAYNRVEKTRNFSVAPGGNAVTGMVGYSSADASLANSKGKENFFSGEELPGYSHSFLLTGVLSPDYVDLTGDGITTDDLGDGVRINYSRVFGISDNASNTIMPGDKKGLYKWRIPYNSFNANYQEGFRTLSEDDKGNYTYGEKEIWYVHSIESKTMVAMFILSDREDGLEVAGEHGGQPSNPKKLKKLDRIELYAKSDLINYGSNAVPIKTVHFKYSYNLCKHVDNNTGAAVNENGGAPTEEFPNVNAGEGKLTLERIYFTYQKNTKGRLNPYVFTYDNYNNPDYNLKNYDRWGNYKNNSDAGIVATNVDFPYTIQDRIITDNNARSWSISSITLPTGGKIELDYESDDYAYIQNKLPGQMFQIAGFGNSNLFDQSNSRLYNTQFPPFNDASEHNRYIFIKPDAIVTAGNVDRYLKDIKQLYYRCAVKMYSEHSSAMAEYIPGYSGIESYGVCSDEPNTIWILLKGDPLGNDGAEIVNPIMKSAIQFLRMNIPKLAYPYSENDGSDFVEVIKSLISPLFDIQNMFMGYSRACMARSWCRDVVKERSWVRLNNANGVKLGGGARVKQITMSDSWDAMVAGEAVAKYGQVYDYTKKADDGTIISSGVAEYEPLIGGDEISLRQPIKYLEKAKLAPHTAFFIEEPVTEEFFPSPSVIYSEVKVSSYASQTDDQTGYTIHKYYTAYDFPLSYSRTALDPHIDQTPSVFQILQLPKVEHFTGSQGFQVELNDMHGKPKSETVYDNLGNIISSTEYKYVTDNDDAKFKHLKNEVEVMLPDGTIAHNSPVGKSVELMTDFRFEDSKTFMGGGLIAIDISAMAPTPPIPIPIVTFFPSISAMHSNFRSAATMKVVRRFGILKSTTVKQYGSTVTTENLVYDSETGDVLLTSTQNEYDDLVYNFTYPAHFAYEGMGPAYKNIGAEFTDVFITSGEITSPTSIVQYFTDGDEVLITRAGVAYKAWVINPSHTSAGGPDKKLFVQADGSLFHNIGKLKLKIVRSGRRNMSAAPIASITSLNSPINSGVISPSYGDKIINTTVTEYDNEWKINCEKITTSECDSCATPSCECMYSLLSYISENNLWTARAEDSVFVNLCCFDSCYFDNGTLSDNSCVNECRRHFYVDSVPSDIMRKYTYTAHIGRCILEIRRETNGIYSKVELFDRNINQLTILKPNDVIFVENACLTVCNNYEETGDYILQSVVYGQRVTPYKARLICNPICHNVCVDLNENKRINPYRLGLLGNWRPEKQWVYRGMRTPDNINTLGTTDIRNDGVFKTYDEFWLYDVTANKFTRDASLAAEYIDATTITKYNRKGAEIENRDAAGIYSAALFGYLETQATAVAKNARYKQIGFDSFEDYDFATDCKTPCRVDHFNFRERLYNEGCISHCAEIDTTDAHAGNRSLKILASGSGTVGLTRDLVDDGDDSGVEYDGDSLAFLLKRDGCLPKFAPDEGEYFVSLWVKEPQNCNTLAYENAKVRISFTGNSDVYEFVPTGNVIEGWQRVEGRFPVASSATQIKVDLMALNGTTVNFDDLRIQPFNSSMKTYVYDWRSMRLMAELDENNYASFYQYDDSGALVRVLKETVKGIMTIQENRTSLKR